MARYTYQRSDSGEINVKKLFNSSVSDKKLQFILKNKCWSQIKKIVNREKVRSIPLKELDDIVKYLEKQGLVPEDFKDGMRELRRSEKAKKASNKHARKKVFQTAFLDIDILKNRFERNVLKEEIIKLEAEIRRYKHALYSYSYNQATIQQIW
ncbi:hypothetical protein LOD99_2504 [Oopsacas minuta]|uniref:Uncharacterized protein n=1 Tax=Oopsacas minuta TaxID=111878 RepID=A0AAV7K2S5_9METZ|nr:hypothetical protein LOD99_2504 [Oopsacas minuta]